MKIDKIKKEDVGYCGLFANPESLAVVQDWIERLPKQDRVTAYTAMGMTANFYSTLIEKENIDKT